ncbi:hypothetical protein [Emticicia sp. 21SJ11W-3]|uniref:hypothetical protein n=1 Tax=Emticicia sp. 21SJ11W-3 TaxID=2916755 RepID=UPI00209E6BCA|nr:hypothetical protein [Emticicia sp. 21SJ11W-3]UTA69062.1 hypothetical protein MB380_04485 [Emticicia sp. 21SJ11W-3]
MKLQYFIPAIVIVLNTISCTPKNTKDPQPVEDTKPIENPKPVEDTKPVENPQPVISQNINYVSKGNYYFQEITYDASGNPTIVREFLPTHEATLKISYEKNLAKTMIFEPKNGSYNVEYTINYINANELTIGTKSYVGPSKWLTNASLKFNANGLVESITTIINGYSRTFNYRYDKNDNLIYAENLNESFPVIYEEYDDKPNPFYAKAKLWTIIELIERQNSGTVVDFAICKNNPRKSITQNNNFTEKLIYTYDKNSYPVKIIQQIYSPSYGDGVYKEDVIQLTYAK